MKNVVDRRFARDVMKKLSPETLQAFKIKCSFYDLNVLDVISHLVILFGTTEELDKYFNISPEDSIFLKDRLKNYSNLKRV